MWNKIVNPTTGNKVNLNSKIGKSILRNYMKQSGGSRQKKPRQKKPRMTKEKRAELSLLEQQRQEIQLNKLLASVKSREKKRVEEERATRALMKTELNNVLKRRLAEVMRVEGEEERVEEERAEEERAEEERVLMKTEQEEINNALRRRLAEVMRKDEINNAQIRHMQAEIQRLQNENARMVAEVMRKDEINNALRRHMQAEIQRLQNENAREESDSDTDGEFFDSKQH